MIYLGYGGIGNSSCPLSMEAVSQSLRISGPHTSPSSPQESTALSTLGKLSLADLSIPLEYCCIESPAMLDSLNRIVTKYVIFFSISFQIMM